MHIVFLNKISYAVIVSLSETDKQIRGAAWVIVPIFLTMMPLQGALAPRFPFKKEVRFFTGVNAFATFDLWERFMLQHHGSGSLKDVSSLSPSLSPPFVSPLYLCL